MPRPQTILSELEQSRTKKLQELGYLTYNLSVNGKALTPTQLKVVRQMKNCIQRQTDDNSQEDEEQVKQDALYLNEKATELGLLCYNDSVDRGHGPSGIETLLAEINQLNGEILRWQSVNDPEKADEESFIEDLTDSLRMEMPYGMEWIPENYKRCRCGYRNRSYARFCGKCGTKLP